MRKMTRGMVGEENQIEKQMGCMAGFLHIFDRHQLLAGKRIYSAKRLPPSTSPETDSSPEPDNYDGSPAESTPTPSSPERVTQSPTPKTPPPLSVFEFKEGTRSSWKFSREAPRLSLDSRAVVDAKGTLHPRQIRANPAREVEKQRRSTSVVARLMGLEEPIPDSDSDPELRRSSSESRVSKDVPPQFQYRFFDANNFQLKQFKENQSHSHDNAAVDSRLSNGRSSDPKRNAKTEAAFGFRVRGMGQKKKSFYDSTDFFPEPKQSVSIYGEIERRLRMRGIDEPSKDLDTLKQILEALQLKGLLHSNKSMPPTNHRNFVFDGTKESPIVVMKPARFSNRTGRIGSDSPPPTSLGSSPRARRSSVSTVPAASPKRDRPEANRNGRAHQSQGRAGNASSPTSSESPNRFRKVLNMETQRKANNGVAPVHSAKISSRRNAPDQQVASPSPRMRKASHHEEEKVLLMGVAEDEASTVSESSFSASPHTDTERFKMEEYKEGRDLLERCDKLLRSIAEITAATIELQPSPVSVLDSSFYKDESSCSPSPVMKRCIDYKDAAADSEYDMWSAALCCSEAKSEDSEDFVYVSEILRASIYMPEDSDVFLLLEKQQYLNGNDTSKPSTLRRRLIFDIIHEILNRNRRLPPWKAVSWAENNTPALDRIWFEFRRIREREEESEDLFEVICGVLRKDIAEDAMNEWEECPLEMGDVVLDIERLVFKDLIVETIRDLASFKGPQWNKVSALRRKLVF